jgi:acetyl-CoA carboxylase biotin carboxyl carrier protein
MIRNGLRVRAKSNVVSEQGDSSAAAPIDTDFLRQLAQLIDETGLVEIEIEKGDLRVRLTRQHMNAAPTAPSALAPVMAVPVAAAATGAPAAPAAGGIEPDNPGLVKSPMVGTVYRRANPESKAFVELGSTVKSGDRVLLVEAMKTFNDIVAHKSGVVTAILVEDGQPVEYGEPLLLID